MGLRPSPSVVRRELKSTCGCVLTSIDTTNCGAALWHSESQVVPMRLSLSSTSCRRMHLPHCCLRGR
jgi:hypothetical protein